MVGRRAGPGWWPGQQTDVRARRRRLLLERRRRGRVEGHGGVLCVALLALDQVGVCDGVCAGAGARGAGSSSRREERVLGAVPAQRREEGPRLRGEGAGVRAIGEQRRWRPAAGGVVCSGVEGGRGALAGVDGHVSPQ
jgi:hypothetical protein